MSIYSQVDGVFSDDIFAYCYVAEALRREIRIPEQLKVIGYDGNEITQVSIPRITTIVQDVPLLAHNCIEVLLHRIAGETVQKETLIPVKYKKGGTV